MVMANYIKLIIFNIENNWFPKIKRNFVYRKLSKIIIKKKRKIKKKNYFKADEGAFIPFQD